MSSVKQTTIAKELNVSVATVSRSLANHPSISIETRARVSRLAEKLGYLGTGGRRSAGNRRAKKEIRIGVLVGLQANSSGIATFPLILKGIHERAAAENVSVEVRYEDPSTFDPEARGNPVIQCLRKLAWHGLILIYPYTPSVVESLARRTAIVTTFEDYDKLRIDSIDTNHHSGIVRMIEKLVSLGHRRIGFVTWVYSLTGNWSTQRFLAYVNGVFNAGIEFRQEWIFNVHKAAPTLSRSEIAEEAIRKMRKDGVTAWVCAADHQAYQLIADLHARGIRVPEDCSVTGFDGIEPPSSIKPVTSLRAPSEAIGGAAVVRLINRIAHPKAPPRKILVETALIEGTTVARPPVRSL